MGLISAVTYSASGNVARGAMPYELFPYRCGSVAAMAVTTIATARAMMTASAMTTGFCSKRSEDKYSEKRYAE